MTSHFEAAVFFRMLEYVSGTSVVGLEAFGAPALCEFLENILRV